MSSDWSLWLTGESLRLYLYPVFMSKVLGLKQKSCSMELFPTGWVEGRLCCSSSVCCVCERWLIKGSLHKPFSTCRFISWIVLLTPLGVRPKKPKQSQTTKQCCCSLVQICRPGATLGVLAAADAVHAYCSVNLRFSSVCRLLPVICK